MLSSAIIPLWFVGYNIALEFLFALVSFAVSHYAFKVHRISMQRPARLFGFAFLFIGIAYVVQSLLNLGIVEYFGRNAYALYVSGIYIHMALWVVALTALSYVACKSENRHFYLLLLTSLLLSIFFSANGGFLFYLLSSLLLVFISVFYFQNYMKNRQLNTMLILMAFLFLLFGKIHFLFALDHGTYYVVGHVLELAAYLLILANLILVLRHDKKA